MSRHAFTSDARPRTRTGAARMLDWHDRRPRASMSSARGWIWAGVVAVSFFYMSNPLVFVREFQDSLEITIRLTLVAALVTLPWMRLPRIPWPWVAFIGWCALSLVWTIDTAETADSLMLYLELTALAVVVAANCEAPVVCWGLGLGGVVVVVLSVYAFERTMWGSQYAALEGVIFTGVGTNQNILAYTIAIAIAATLALGPPRQWPARLAWSVVLVVNGYGIYLANSGTGYLSTLSILLAGVVLLALPVLRGLPRRVALTCAAAAAAVLVAGMWLVVVVLDKQLITLSGRTPFWQATLASTLDRSPLAGSGWGAVWEHPWDLTPVNDVALDIYARAGYPLPHGHNFFVDVVPELGLIGTLIAVAMVAWAMLQAARSGVRAGAPDPACGRLLVLVLVALLVSGITEPMLTVPLGWWTLTLVTALASQRSPAPTPRELPVPGAASSNDVAMAT